MYVVIKSFTYLGYKEINLKIDFPETNLILYCSRPFVEVKLS